ncbi:MAG: SCP2 sterol-binding domain-containing protein [Thermodesulfobacteriota bacterium]
MAVYQYCTPEWFEELEKRYRQDSTNAKQLNNLTLVLCFRVQANSSWGIDRDMIFGARLNGGSLVRLGLFSEEEAAGDATFVLSAAPEDWKRLLRRESSLVTEFMLGRVKLEKGSRIAILKLAPLSDKLINFMRSAEIQFPDEMSADEFERYRTYMEKVRVKLGV